MASRSISLIGLGQRIVPLGMMVGGLWPTSAAAAPFVYVANFNANSVAVIDTAAPGGPAMVATVPLPALPAACGPEDCGPGYVAITPNGADAYVTLSGGPGGPNSVAVIDTALALTDPANAVVGVVPVGVNPQGVAITPDGAYVYVANGGSDSVSVIDTTLALTNPAQAVVATVLLDAGVGPHQVVISPDGAHAWVTERARRSLAAIDTALALTTPAVAEVAEVPLRVTPFDPGAIPFGLAVSPDGGQIYVAASTPQSAIMVADAATALGSPMNAIRERILSSLFGAPLFGLAFRPDGGLLYAVNGAGSLLLLNPARLRVDQPGDLAIFEVIKLGTSVVSAPFWVAVSQDGTQAYVTITNDVTVSAINVVRNTAVGSPISAGPPGAESLGLAITPNLTALARLGSGLLAGGSVDLSMVVSNPTLMTSVTWDFFGNGTQVQTTPTSTTQFTYPTAGTFTLKVTVQLADGTSVSATEPVFVQSQAQAIAKTITLVQHLGSLNAGQQNSLLTKLNAASDALGRANSTAACGQLGAFVDEGTSLVQQGVLTRLVAAPVLNEGAALRGSLACQ
jgi:YVTN family beta-propeller protein